MMIRILPDYCQNHNYPATPNRQEYDDEFCPKMKNIHCVSMTFLIEKNLQIQIQNKLREEGCQQVVIVDNYIHFTSSSGQDKNIVMRTRENIIEAVIYHLDDESNLLCDETKKTFTNLSTYNLEEMLAYASQ